MAGLIYDSSVYIDSFRRGDYSLLLKRNAKIDDEPFTVYLSAVVLSELLAGAVDARPRKLLENLETQFQNLGRLVVPTKTDWSLCGQILLRVGQKRGFEQIKRSRMTNDCLIATSAVSLGLTIATTNLRDFEMISEIRPIKLLKI